MPIASAPLMVPPWDSEAWTAHPGHTRSRTWIDDAGYTRVQTLMWIFNDLGSAATLGKPYMVRFQGTAGQNPAIVAAAASPSDTPELVCVPITAIADQTYGYACVEGFVEALVEGGTDCTRGDYLSVDDDIISGGAFKEDTTTRTKNSFAMYMDPTDETTGSAATLRLIYMFGQEAEVLT